MEIDFLKVAIGSLEHLFICKNMKQTHCKGTTFKVVPLIKNWQAHCVNGAANAHFYHREKINQCKLG